MELSDPPIIPRPPEDEEFDDAGGSLENEETDDSDDEPIEDDREDDPLDLDEFEADPFDLNELKEDVALELDGPRLTVVSLSPSLDGHDSADSGSEMISRVLFRSRSVGSKTLAHP